MTVADFLIGGEGGLIVCGELCPDRDQISLSGKGLECGEVGLKMELGHEWRNGPVVCTLGGLGQLGCVGSWVGD